LRAASKPVITTRRVATTIAWIVALAIHSSQASAQPALTAVKAVAPPTIDGEIGDQEWQGAAIARDFIQYEPRRGDRSPFSTEALVLYDDRTLYVAFRAPDPDTPVAQLTQRDADLFSDDAVIVILDSFYDRQSAYYFMTNPLGAQSDGRVADDGRTVDGNWDAPWRSAARRSDAGWSAEIAVPLGAIKYVAGSDRRWGLNLGRVRRRSLEVAFWAGPLDALLRVSQAGVLTALTVPAPQRRHQVIPYGLGRLQQGQTSQWEAGLDLRYGLTPTTAAYGTLNPDFATVEADQEQVNLTRFEIALREKRQFFLEGQELFGQRIRTFYSRRVADVAAGAKLLGKQGPWALAFLSARADPLGTGDYATYTVGRVQRDLGRSNVAATLASRRLGGLDEGSASVDATLFFTKTVGFTGQLAKGFGRYSGGTWAYYVRPSYDSPTGHFHVRYTHLGDRFGDTANAIGFIRDDNRRELDSAVSKTFWVKSGAVEKVDYNSNYNIYWGQTGQLRSWRVDEVLDVELRNRWGARTTWTEELTRFEKGFRNRQVGLEIGYNTRAYESVRGGVQFGRNFDADFQLWSVLARRKLTEALSAEYELQRLTLDPDPEGAGTWIHVVRASQAFTPDLVVRAFFQANSAIDRRNVEAVFVYRYRPPFGTLQLVYQKGTAGFGQRSDQGHTLFLKTTAVF
jgi:hypothetical protein